MGGSRGAALLFFCINQYTLLAFISLLIGKSTSGSKDGLKLNGTNWIDSYGNKQNGILNEV